MKSVIKILFVILISSTGIAGEVSFTMDDPEVTSSPLMSSAKRNQAILNAFSKHNVKGALFVCGMRIDNKPGRSLLKSWDDEGHLIANHSYSHLYFHSGEMTFEKFSSDFLKVEPLISGFKNFVKLFRFPYLKEGNTAEKRDKMRSLLTSKEYGEGYVTIDASDWYIDQRMRERLTKNPKADLKPYRDFYLKHIWQRTLFYDDLARKVFGRPIKHTLLIHHNLLNALFLDDLMDMFKSKEWNLISASEAFNDSIFKLHPDILPAGESIVWAAAKESGKYEDILRYPGEDGEYEKAEMDQLGL